VAAPVFGGMGAVFQDTLGEDTVYTPQGGEPVSLRGVFLRAFEAIEIEGGGPDVQSASVQVAYPSDQVPDAAIGDEVQADGQAWSVIAVQPDGVAMTRLFLHLKA